MVTRTLSLGWVPPRLEVNLDRDGDFVAQLISDSGDLPTDTEVELRFTFVGASPVVWPADVDGDSIQWNIPKQQVAAVLDANPVGAKLHYSSPLNDLVWYKGGARDRS